MGDILCLYSAGLGILYLCKRQGTAVLQNFCQSLSYRSVKCSKTWELTATQIIMFLSYIYMYYFI